MKKIVKIILALLEVVAVVLAFLVLFVAPIKEFIGENAKFVYTAAIMLTVIWIVILCIHLFNKESGRRFEGKMKFREDKERNQLNIDERDTQDVYSNFERAEFATKVKEPYQKEVHSYTDELYNEHKPVEEPVAAPVEEVKVEEPAPVVEETPVVAEPIPEPVVEEVKEEINEEPKVEVKPVKREKVARKLEKLTVWEGFETEVSEGWVSLLRKDFQKKDIQEKLGFIKGVYESGKQVYPAKEKLFKPFKLTDLNDVKVVIIGKIPYYRKNQADGLAYSTDVEQAPNQSTTVIINEAISDVGIAQPENGSLEKWAKQGVFLINSCLSAPSDKPASHAEYWKKLTDHAIEELIEDKSPKVFLLWGEHAQSFKPLIEQYPVHMIIEAPSPSPLSAANGFYNSKPFSRINEFLEKNGLEPINWELK